jgi:hypothetical protein
MGVDEHHEHARKGSVKGKAKNGVPSSLRKIVSYFFVLVLLACLLNMFF